MRVACLLVGGWLLLSVTATTAGVAGDSASKESLPPGALARLGTARFANFGRVFALAFSADSRLLAGGAWDGTIQLWDVQKRELVRQWQAQPAPIQSLAFSPDGTTLASAGKNGVTLWNPETGQLRKSLREHAGPVSLVAFSPTGKHLMSRGNKELAVWDSSGTLVSKAKGPIGGFPYFSAEGTEVAFAASRDLAQQTTTIAVIDVLTGKETRRVPLPVASRGTSFFSPTGRYLARAEDFFFSVYDTRARRDHRVFESKANYHPYVTSVPFSADERFLAAALVEGHRVVVMEMATRRIRCEFRAPDYAETVHAFSPDGRFLAGGSVDRSVLLWDLTGQAHGEPASVALSPKELAALWVDLTSAEGRTAQRAIWRLVAGAESAVPFLEKTLQAPQVDQKRIAQLLHNLNSEAFVTRRQAFDELEKLRDVAELGLKKSLANLTSSLEHRRRVEDLLGRIDIWWEQQWRFVRAIEVLERIGNSQAMQVLARLAKNESAPRLGGEAHAALTRLTRPAHLGRPR